MNEIKFKEIKLDSRFAHNNWTIFDESEKDDENGPIFFLFSEIIYGAGSYNFFSNITLIIR